MTKPDEYELGKRIGQMILDLFQLIADIDEIPLQDAIDDWVSGWVAERIINKD